MNILITGGTGFIGQHLCPFLQVQNHQLWILTRDKVQARKRLPQPGLQFAQHLAELEDQHFDAVINLAGAPIAQRWSKKHQTVIWQSRINFTEQLIAFLLGLKQPPAVLISGSAVGFYGDRGDKILTEDSGAGYGFSSELCQAWEKAAVKATPFMRVCLLRTGLVLGKNGGILQRMRLPFLAGVGGPLGSGEQWMSWIHWQDMIRIIQFCLQKPNLAGPINATAPFPVTNETFARIYADTLHRPALLKTPGFLLGILYGEMADELLLSGQRVLPAKLQQAQFVFRYPELNQALATIQANG